MILTIISRKWLLMEFSEDDHCHISSNKEAEMMAGARKPMQFIDSCKISGGLSTQDEFGRCLSSGEFLCRERKY